MQSAPILKDRREAGRTLAPLLDHYAGRDDVIVLALPRGGVPVAYEVAEALRAPLDVFVVRKLGVPGQEELAMGAIATGGVRVLVPTVVESFGISGDTIEAVAAKEWRELERRERQYRAGRPAQDVRGRVAILIDDGLATGATMRAAAAALRELGPARVVVAAPVGAEDACESFRSVADEVVCAFTPEPFYGVGIWYDDFSQTSDEEVHDLLVASRSAKVGGGGR
jgi:predicted phosphoribosyltransferase